MVFVCNHSRKVRSSRHFPATEKVKQRARKMIRGIPTPKMTKRAMKTRTVSQRCMCSTRCALSNGSRRRSSVHFAELPLKIRFEKWLVLSAQTLIEAIGTVSRLETIHWGKIDCSPSKDEHKACASKPEIDYAIKYLVMLTDKTARSLDLEPKRMSRHFVKLRWLPDNLPIS